MNINRIQVQAPGGTYVNGVALPGTTPMAGTLGTVTMYAAAPSGAPSADDSAAASANIQQNVRPSAVYANLNSAPPVNYTQTLTVWAQPTPGLTAAALQAACENSVTQFFAAYPIGGIATDSPATPNGMYGTGLAAVIGASNPSVFFVENAAQPGTPPPDQPMSVGQVMVDDVTINVRFAQAA